MRGGGRTALVAAVLTLGCGITDQAGYLARAGWSEARLLLRRQPIGRLLARPDIDPALRERLSLALAVRRFAHESLGLRVGDSFTTYAEVGGDATVHVVSAARRDRLEAYTWWYPIVGRVPYRGFFQRAGAERLATALAARDLDVEVRPAVAFSTLGWFADPLVSTATEGSPVELTETIVHELFHATLYVPGQAAFNESAATFVGHRGAVAFFCTGPGTHAARCTEARRRWQATRVRGRILERLAARLARLYAAVPPVAARERARARLASAAAAALARRGLADGGLVPPNNARLLGELLYLRALARFDALAPADASLGPAVAALVGAMAAAPDPFAALETLARQPEQRYSAGHDRGARDGAG